MPSKENRQSLGRRLKGEEDAIYGWMKDAERDDTPLLPGRHREEKNGV